MSCQELRLTLLVSTYRNMRKKYALNCWNFVKTYQLQHNAEICVSVNVTKVEKMISMQLWLNPNFTVFFKINRE